jgi:hypothetical protein
VVNCYGPKSGCFGGLVAKSTKTGFSQWFKGLSQSKTKPEAFQIVFNAYRKHNPTGALQFSTIFSYYGPRELVD